MARARAKARYEIGVIDRASAQIQKIEKNFTDFNNTVNKIGNVFAAVAGAGAVGAFINKVTQAGVELFDLNKKIGAGIEAMSQYRHVAGQSNVEFKTLATSFEKMHIRISEATRGTGEAEKVLRELGLEAGELAKLAPEQQFEHIARAFEGITSSGDRARIATKLFEESGVSLLQILDQGADGIARLRQEADDFGLTITTEQATAMAEFDSGLNKIKNAAFAVGQQLVLTIGGPFSEFATALAKGVPNAMDLFRKSMSAGKQIIFELARSIREVDAKIWGFIETITWGDVSDKAREEQRAAMADVVKFNTMISDAIQEQIDVMENSREAVLFTSEAYDKVYNEALKRTVEKTKEVSKATKETEKDLSTMGRAMDMIEATFEKLEVEEARRFAGLTTEVKEAAKETEKMSDVGRRFGMTFESALEDAIVKTKGFQDVIRGLIDDIAKLIVRTTITEPLAAAVGGYIGTKFGTTAAKGGTPGTTKQAGGVVVNINGPVNDASLIPLVRQAATEGARQGYAMVQADIQGGGPIRRMIK